MSELSGTFLFYMTLDNIIEHLNAYIRLTRTLENIEGYGFLVLHRVTTVHPIIKAYKNIEYTLWCIDSIQKYKVITIKTSQKILYDTEEAEAIRAVEESFMIKLFELLRTEVFTNIINGTYKD